MEVLIKNDDPNQINLRHQGKYQHQPYSTADGLEITFDRKWVLLRKSNTEPMIRIYAGAPAIEQADFLANEAIIAIQYFIAVLTTVIIS